VALCQCIHHCIIMRYLTGVTMTDHFGCVIKVCF
jgi:hypothetical protein